MTLLLFALAFGAQFALVGGQILLKRAVVPSLSRFSRPHLFVMAITCMTLYFFTWLGVAGWLPLSQLAPFDAFGPVLLVIWARLTLRERLTTQAWLAAVLVILLGVGVIAFS